MKPLFLGGHVALDFLNSRLVPTGSPIETIGDGGSLVSWLNEAGLVTEDEVKRLRRHFGTEELDRVAAEARRVREWARAWVERWRVEPKGDYREEIAELNKLLSYCHSFYEVGESETLMRRNRLDETDALIALLAEPLAELVTQEEALKVKHCGGPGCSLIFLDRTKAHKRIYCSADVCGNRAKVAAFRERKRAQRL